MKLKDILIREGFYGTTQYWILPAGKLKKMANGHEEYLADEGMTYGKAFKTGHIRVAVGDYDKVPTAEWSKAATSAAKRTLAKMVKDSDQLYYDFIDVKPDGKVKYLKSGDTDYRGFLKIR